MASRYETDGTLEGNRLIRLNEPLPWKEGPVRIIVIPPASGTDLQERNRPALEALDRLLAEPDDLTAQQWIELDRLIEEHPLRIRKGSPAQQ